MIPGVGGFEFVPPSGEEIHPLMAKGLFSPLTPHLQTARFFCVIKPPSSAEERWHPLARNKYSDDVAGILVPASGDGLIIMLPQVREPAF